MSAVLINTLSRYQVCDFVRGPAISYDPARRK
jgi:hypothetical protein